MTLKHDVIAAIVGQFGRPRGTAGSVTGWVMAHRPSNRQRNSWRAPTQRLNELRRRLTPGGRIAIASQPRCPGATASTSRDTAHQIEALPRDAGYTKARTETLDLDPPVVCVLAANPDPARDRSSPGSDPTSEVS